MVPSVDTCRVEFGLLGSLTCRRAGRTLELGPPRQQALLAVMLVQGGRTVSGSDLLDAVWGDELPATGTRVLPPYVYRLRRCLGDAADVIVRDGPGYRAAVTPDQLDLTEFDQLADAGQDELMAGNTEAAVDLLRRAAELWRDEACAGLPGPFLARWRTGVGARRRQVVERRIAADLDLGRHAEVIAELVTLVAREPGSEPLAEMLMLAQHRCGRQADALAVHRRLRSVLAREFGVEPNIRIQTLQQMILRGDPEPGAADGGAAGRAVGVFREREGRTQLPRLSTDFVGRRAELAEIVAVVDSAAGGPASPVIAIDGMAGVGKTALAVAAAHRLGRRHPDGFLFLDLHGHTPDRAPVPPVDALETLLRAIGETRALPPDLEERAALWRAGSHGRRLLLVLDNVLDAGQVEPLLPAEPRCVTLVTGRERLPGLHVAHALSLGVLPEADACDLLLGALGETGVDPSAARDMVRGWGRLPLAILIGARRCRAFSGTPGDTVAPDAGQDTAVADPGAGERTVRAAFALSYDHLSDGERRTFRRLAAAPGPDVDMYAAAALTACTPDAAAGLLERLVDANMLQQPAPGRFRFHDLLRAYAGALLDDGGDERYEATAGLLDFYREAALGAVNTALTRFKRSWATVVSAHHPVLANRAEALEWLDTEAANLVAATVAALDGWPVHSWQLAARLTEYLVLRCRFDDAWKLNRVGLAAAIRVADPAVEAGLRMHRGHLLAAEGRLDPAIEQYQLALGLRRELGDRSGETTLLNNIANMETTAGRYADSLRHLGEVLAVLDPEAEPAAVAYAQVNMAELGHRMGRHEEAAHAAATAARLMKQEGSDVRLQAYALVMLGRALVALGRPTEALEPLLQAVDIGTFLNDPVNLSTALTYLGTAQRLRGDTELAGISHRRAIEAVERGGPPAALQVAALGHADTLLATGQAATADAWFRRALDAHDQVGDPHTQIRALRGLARCAADAGRPGPARDLAAEADAVEAALAAAAGTGDERD
jgi:DNA-binding SARP family transcriptional activator/tetratricopeptide (TPR) repeat protein